MLTIKKLYLCFTFLFKPSYPIKTLGSSIIDLIFTYFIIFWALIKNASPLYTFLIISSSIKYSIYSNSYISSYFFSHYITNDYMYVFVTN